ncbi:MAG: protein kinase [Sandaracinus sp.]|nr:protein kinase [Sandaracinus sp.]
MGVQGVPTDARSESVERARPSSGATAANVSASDVTASDVTTSDSGVGESPVRSHARRRSDVPEPSSARDALLLAEASRIRLFAVSMFFWSLSGVAMVALLPGDPLAHRFAYVGSSMLCACFAVLAFLAHPDRMGDGRGTVSLAVVIPAAAITLGYGLGPFSTYVALVAVGLTLFAISVPPLAARASLVTLAVGYPAVAVPMHLGWIPDVSLLATAPSPAARIATILGTEFGLFTAWGIGRLARRKHAAVVGQLEREVRRSARREALLREAQEELARAAGVGEGRRFTDQELGPWRLGNVLGRGGMGEVYDARHEDGSVAAVKVLRRDVLGDPSIVRRFADEVRTAAALASPHVVRVLDVGGDDAPLPYLAMERLQGDDLASVLRQRGPLPLRDVVELVVQVCEGLATAHAAGVVHRDLKPQNLFLTRAGNDDRWTILDFGIAKVGRLADEATGGSLVGTPTYMAPEQVRGAGVDGRTDLYALAAVVYRALTGEPVFGGSDVPRVLRDVVETMPRHPGELRELPADVVAVLRVGLAKEPADRFADARAMAEAFRHAARGSLPEALRQRARALESSHPWRAVDPREAESTRSALPRPR